MIKNCHVANDYLDYLSVIKGRSKHTLQEYEVDLRMFFRFVNNSRGLTENKNISDFSFVDIDLIKTITLVEMHAFIAFCKN